jgi:hypothetical protein
VEAQGTWSGGIIRSIAVMASRSAAGRSGASEVGGRGGGSTVADASEASFAGGRPRQSAGKRRLAAMISCSLPEDPVREDKKKVRNRWWDPYLCLFFPPRAGLASSQESGGWRRPIPRGHCIIFLIFFTLLFSHGPLYSRYIRCSSVCFLVLLKYFFYVWALGGSFKGPMRPSSAATKHSNIRPACSG